MTQEEFDTQFVQHQSLIELMNVSRCYFDKYIVEDKFPQPIRAGKTKLWHKQAIKNHELLLERGVEL
jgi:predicted DNA-binding transcriptional regulator AlpA